MLKKFHKYQGAGNDFVMLNNNTESINKLSTKEIATICHRRFGIGSDGLIIIDKSDSFDFAMKYYNADGKEGTMCGNGGRCAVQFAYDLGIIDKKPTFEAIDGIHEAVIEGDNIISLKMSDVEKIENNKFGTLLNTGSPHLVIQTKNLNEYDVYNEGKKLRYNDYFSPEGVNVNFYEINNNTINIRTYERGVEDETYACGTGSVATAIAAFFNNKIEESNNVQIKAKGGNLFVSFQKKDKYESIWLKGAATKVFSGYDFVK